MPISDSERRFIDEVSLTLPWSLVKPLPGCRGGDRKT